MPHYAPITPQHQKFQAKLARYPQVNHDLTDRGAHHIPHHPTAQRLVSDLECADWLLGGDELRIKVGGEGDNGEHLTSLLDIIFELREAEALEAAGPQNVMINQELLDAGEKMLSVLEEQLTDDAKENKSIVEAVIKLSIAIQKAQGKA